MIRIGLLGAGFMGTTHGEAFSQILGAEVVAVLDHNDGKAKRLATRLGCRVESDPEKLFADPGLDVIDITLPTPFHPEFAIRALNAGKHVIIEKPLSLSIEACNAMLEAAERSGMFLMVAHVIRFWPEYEAVQQVIASGHLGEPRLATSWRLSGMPQWATWFRDPAQFGGAVLDLQIHDLDFMNLLFGSPRQAKAIGLQDETGGWNHVVTQLEYTEGRASVEASCMLPDDFPFTVGLRVVCAGGTLEYNFRAGGASFEQGQPTSSLLLNEPGRPNQPLSFPASDGYRNELAYFLHCVETGAPPTRVTPQDARLAVQTAIASRVSLESGAPVMLSTIQ